MWATRLKRAHVPVARAEKLLANGAGNGPIYIFERSVVARKTKTVAKARPEATSAARAEAGLPISAKVRRPSSKTKKTNQTVKTARKTRSTVAGAAMATPTDEEIRTRAYFISERRRRFGLPGDANSDWIEAKRQLLSEAGRR
jgi:hypothetical protein